ncbi:MAG: dihydropteroate synthase [Burkholderiaceae bacterium]
MKVLDPVRQLSCGRFTLSLDRPLLMGIVNVTPDSFSDGGQFASAAQAIEHARRLVDDGADLLDIGGESTRPGAEPVSPQQELDRTGPVLEGLLDCGRPLSVDTRRPEVMRAALALGADMINDIAALRTPGAIDAVAGSRCAVCLMHMLGEPSTMQQAPVYQEVVSDVEAFLQDRIEAAQAAGIARERIVIDPGIGFGKTTRHNLTLLGALDEFAALGQPLLLGVSRKSLIGALTGRDAAQQRLAGSLAAALAGVARGAAILRVHDVAATRDALRVWQAIDEA